MCFKSFDFDEKKNWEKAHKKFHTPVLWNTALPYEWKAEEGEKKKANLFKLKKLS